MNSNNERQRILWTSLIAVFGAVFVGGVLLNFFPISDTQQQAQSEVTDYPTCQDVEITTTILRPKLVYPEEGTFEFSWEPLDDFIYILESDAGVVTGHGPTKICLDQEEYNYSLKIETIDLKYEYPPEKVIVDGSTESLKTDRLCVDISGNWQCEDEMGGGYPTDIVRTSPCEYKLGDPVGQFNLEVTGHYAQGESIDHTSYTNVQIAIAQDGNTLTYYTEQRPAKDRPVNYTEHGSCKRQ